MSNVGCADCFDRSVTIPVGPTGPAGQDGENGVCPECEAAVSKELLLVNLYNSQLFNNDTFVNCLSGTVPADSLEKEGDMIIVEAWFFGNVVNPSIGTDGYTVQLRIDGNDLYTHGTFSSDFTKNVNGTYLKYGLTLTDVTNKTLRYDVLEVRPANVLVFGTSPLEYLFMDNGTTQIPSIGISTSLAVFNLTDLSADFTVSVRGKNTTGSNPYTYICPRLIVTLKKVP